MSVKTLHLTLWLWYSNRYPPPPLFSLVNQVGVAYARPVVGVFNLMILVHSFM